MIIPLKDLEVSQRGLRHPEQVIGILQSLIAGDSIEPITLVPYPDKWVIHDGHHRAVALYLFEQIRLGHINGPKSHITEDLHFKVGTYNAKLKKRTFGKIEDLIKRVTYATSQARKTSASPSGSSSDPHPKSTSRSIE